MDGKATAKDLFDTVRREIVIGLGKAFEPHRSGNPLDVFLKNYDKNALSMFEQSVLAALAQARAEEREALEEVLREVRRYDGFIATEVERALQAKERTP